MQIIENIELSLKTTYKRRCLLGLKHVDPSSAIACHKPARGVFSKYCSDDCGIKYMQSRIDEWVKKGGKRGRLWESVKGAEKREGVVVCAEEWDTLSKKELVETGVTGVKEEVIPTIEVKPKTSKVERDIQRLNPQLDRVVRLREQIKQG
jgi:COMPASS component SPP1